MDDGVQWVCPAAGQQAGHILLRGHIAARQGDSGAISGSHQWQEGGRMCRASGAAQQAYHAARL